MMSPYTKGHRPGKGRAAEKTLTQAVKEAEAARVEARAAQKAAEAASRHADVVCARAVLLCAGCTLVSLLPYAVRAVVQVARLVFSML